MAKNQTIQHKRSSVAGNKPTAAQVAKGELGINFADKSIYTQDGSGNIIELARDIIKATAFPGTPVKGDVWYDTTNNSLKSYDGLKWVNSAFTGKDVLPANTTTTATGAGTSATPYTFTVNYGSGVTEVVDTITITNLDPGQLVPIVDTNAAANGARFSVTNNIADSTGTLVFSIIYSDVPSSASGTVHSASFVVGTGTVYIDIDVTLASAFAQAVNSPVNTLSMATAWTSPNDTLTSTGDLLISKDNVTFGVGPLAIATSDTLYTKWVGSAGSGTGIDGAHGSTITGNVVDSAGGVSSHSLTIDKTVDAFTFTDATGVATSSVQSSNTVTLAGINSYVYLTSADTMDVSVNAGAFGTVPASGTTVSAINGQTVQVRHTSSATALVTVDTTLDISGVSDTFSSTTMSSGIVTPTISYPISGGALSGAITSSAYATVGTAETHASTDWEIYSDAACTVLVTSSLNDTVNKTSWTPTGLTNGTTYYVKVRYKSASFTSSYGTAVSFIPAAPGSAWALITSPAVRVNSTNSLFYDGTATYMSTGNVIVKSTDNGATWTDISPFASTGAYPMVKLDGNLIASGYCCGGSANGFYRSTDNGATWTNVAPAGHENSNTSAFKLTDGSYWTTMWDSSFNEVFVKSTDGGATWTSTPRAPGDATTAFSSFFTTVTYDGTTITASSTAGNFQSTDGINWGPYAPVYATTDYRANSVNSFGTWTNTLQKTTDGGATWADVATGATPPTFQQTGSYQYDAIRNAHVYTYSSGGSSVNARISTDGVTWTADPLVGYTWGFFNGVYIRYDTKFGSASFYETSTDLVTWNNISVAPNQIKNNAQYKFLNTSNMAVLDVDDGGSPAVEKWIVIT